MKASLIALALIFCQQQCLAQSVFLSDTVTWLAKRDQNKTTGDVFSRQTTFVSYGGNKIAITGFSHRRIFQVTGVTDSWPAADQPGKIVFQVLYNNKAGTVSIERTTSGLILLSIDMTPSDPGAMNSVYTIDHFTRQ